MTLSPKVLSSVAFHPFIFAPVWSGPICINQPSAFFTSDSGCHVIAPLEVNGFYPVCDLSDVHSASHLSLVIFPICFLRHSKLSLISASPLHNPVSLSRLLRESGVLEVQALPTFLLLFSSLTYNCTHSYPFSPTGKGQRVHLLEISPFSWILSCRCHFFLDYSPWRYFLPFLALSLLPHNEKLLLFTWSFL